MATLIIEDTIVRVGDRKEILHKSRLYGVTVILKEVDTNNEDISPTV